MNEGAHAHHDPPDATPEPVEGSAAAGAQALKILMVAPTPFFADRGRHVRILEQVRALERRGHKVIVSTYHHGRDVDGVDTVRSLAVPWYRQLAPGASVHKLYVDWFLVSSTLRVAGWFSPDIIHAHMHEGILVGEFVRRRFGTPLVADLQGRLADEVTDHSHGGVIGAVGTFLARAESWLTARPDHILSSSARFAEVVREDFGRDDVTAIASAVDTERFRPGVATRSLRESLGIPPGHRVVVFLGVLNRVQGMDDVLEAASVVLKERDNVHFLVMGYPNAATYRELVDSRGLSHAVTFTGRVDYERAAEYLDLGDVAVSAKLSKTEANGKLFSYMASGLPVVAYDSPINQEILGEFGSYAAFGDQHALATEISRLLDDPAECERLGLALRERVTDRFSWKRACGELEDVYARVLAERAAADEAR